MTAPPAAVQPPRVEPLQSFDSDADTLAWMWLDTRLDHATVQRRAQQLVAQAAARGEPRTAALSAAFEALRLAVFAAQEPGTPARVDKLLQSLQGLGCERALQLGRAAGVYAQLVDWQLCPPQERARALQMLATEGDAAMPGSPPLEQFWTEVALCALHTAQAEREDAWARGLRALVLAQDVGHDLLQAVASLRLAQTLIDDPEAAPAASLLDQAVAAAQRCGPLPVALHHELLLTLLWAGNMRQAGHCLEDWLQAQPALLNPAQLHRVPSLAAAAALARSWQGRHLEAQQLLDAAATPANGHAWPALHVWVVAAAHLQLGQPAQARSLVEQGLAWLQVPGLRPLAPQLARLYGLLGLACEALQDSTAAQRAFAGAQAGGLRAGPGGDLEPAPAPETAGWAGAAKGGADSNAPAVLQGRTDGAHSTATHATPDATTDATPSTTPDVPPDLGKGAPTGAEAGPALAGRSRLLAYIAHEMRNGVFGLQGPMSLLLMAELAPEQRRTLELSDRSAQSLLALCNDVLDLARMQAQHFALRPQPTQLRPLLADTLHSARLSAQMRRLQWHEQVSDGLPPWLLCDGQRVQQVLLNLLGNAIKFTREGSVSVRVDWQPVPPGSATGAAAGVATGVSAGQLTVSVQDTGPGLTASAQALLFQDFAQLIEREEPTPGDTGADGAGITTAPHAAQEPGLGLGLAISHGLVQQMGGHIGVDSVPGQGSRFWFSLPLQTVRP